MEFRQFDSDAYAATLAKWQSEAEQYDGFPHEVERTLQFVQVALTENLPATQTTLAYGVFAKNQNVAAAVCELVLSRRGGSEVWLKLLRVILSPEIDALLELKDVQATRTAVAAHRTAILGSFDVKFEHSADTLKLYGRNDDMLQFLTTMVATLRSSDDNLFDARLEGRWAVLKPSKSDPLK